MRRDVHCKARESFLESRKGVYRKHTSQQCEKRRLPLFDSQPQRGRSVTLFVFQLHFLARINKRLTMGLKRVCAACVAVGVATKSSENLRKSACAKIMHSFTCSFATLLEMKNPREEIKRRPGANGKSRASWCYTKINLHFFARLIALSNRARLMYFVLIRPRDLCVSVLKCKPCNGKC